MPGSWTAGKHRSIADSPESDPNCLAMVRGYRSLVRMAQEARKPIFALKPADGAIGSHAAATVKAYGDFRELAGRIADRVGAHGVGTAGRGNGMTAAFDVVRYQVMWNRLLSVVEEQAQTLVRTAFSTPAREAGDISAGVFDLSGRMLAQAVTGTPGHVNSMALSVGHFVEKFPPETMREGDVFITNDPWKGTGPPERFHPSCRRPSATAASWRCSPPPAMSSMSAG